MTQALTKSDHSSSAPGGLRVILWRWYGMAPAVALLGVFSMLWGVVFLASGYWERMSQSMDENFPIIAAFNDGVTIQEVEELALSLAKHPEIRSAKAVSANVIFENALPERQAWAQEIEKLDAQLIPPSLIVVVNDSVRDRSRRLAGAALVRDEGQPMIDFVWSEGADLMTARSRLAEARKLIDRGQYAALILLLVAWMAFLLVDMRHFVFLVGRDQAFDFVGENIILRRVRTSLERGLIIAVLGAVVAALGLTAIPLIIGMPAPSWALQASLLGAVVFAFVAGVGGHGVMGWLLWRHAHRPHSISIRA